MPDNSQEIDHIEVLYALENTWTINRFWRTDQSKNDRNEWIAKIPVMNDGIGAGLSILLAQIPFLLSVSTSSQP